jgi:hypothetical protein
MKAVERTAIFLALGTICMSMGASLRAATIFDNSAASSDLQIRWPNAAGLPAGRQVGDEISLAGTERYLTRFDFEYWATTANHISFAGPVEARVRFYENTGSLFNGYPTPSPTSFFDSGWFGGFGPTDGDPNRATIIFTEGSAFPYGGLFIPTSDMTWSIEFSGMGAGDAVGLDLYDPPVVGGDYSDYWQNDGTGWTLLQQNGGTPINFGARFFANETIPEPSSVTLWIFGGLGILALTRRLRREE